MKKNFRWFLFCFLVIFILSHNTVSGASVSGRLRTYLYGWQSRNSQDQNHLRLYQSFILNATGLGIKNLSFHTYIRTAHDFRSGEKIQAPTRFFNGYLNWKNIGGLLDLRLGRQFVHFGVGSVTLDGLKVTITKHGAYIFSVIAGAEAPFTREMELQSLTSHSVIGAYLSTAYLLNTRLSLSYIQKKRDDLIRWKQLGITMDRRFGTLFTLLGKCDYNLEAEDIHELLIRLRYIRNRGLSVYSDLGRRKPRIDDDSFFSIFNPLPYDWFRLGGSYQLLEDINIHGEYRLTRLETDQSSRFFMGADIGMFEVGFTNQWGYGGNHLSVYCGAGHNFGDRLVLAARVNFSRFSLEEWVGDMENAVYSYLRVSVVPLEGLRMELSVQHLTNPQYQKDLRLLGTVSYSFRQGR